MNRNNVIRIVRRALRGRLRAIFKRGTTYVEDTQDIRLAPGNPDYDRTVLLTRVLSTDPDFAPYVERSHKLAAAYREAGPQRSVYRRWVVPGAFAVGLLFTAVFVDFLSSGSVYRTGTGEQRTVVLDDGSRVTLNTDTRVAVKFSSERRLIRLERGEAYFDVSHDTSRPFDVRAGKGMVRAVGTAFNVGIREEEIEVAVLEGRVAVTAGARTESGSHPEENLQLEVGQAVTYWRNGVIGTVEAAPADRIKAWREGKLRFRNLHLVDAIAEHNRYTNNKIIIGNEKLKLLSVSGVFEIGDTDSLVFLLQESLGLDAIRRDNAIILLPGQEMHARAIR